MEYYGIVPDVYQRIAKATRRVVKLSEPDRLGRYHYQVEWMAWYHPGHPDGEYRWAWRGQNFHGHLEDEVVVDYKRRMINGD
jgi:hypothetical protein